ncbi:hypothetical protein TNCV_4796001 [Trichonephila clavipes]|nr:hypothetical protein TNCV_4796001 [Trichonephila clavipes]
MLQGPRTYLEFYEGYLHFQFKRNFPDNITKRSFLSQSTRLLDPFGFLTPCTVSIKILSTVMAVEIRLGQSSSRSACNEMENIPEGV